MTNTADNSDLQGRHVLLGVCGGIAAYKSVDLVRRLVDQGAEVRVVMTDSACKFVTPLTFQAVSGSRVGVDLLDTEAEAAMGHIELARWADQILIAPATANFIARLASGVADDLLSTLCVATSAPVIVAPAMNRQMWANQATQANVRTVQQRGIRVVGPGDGAQACGEVGPGRMLEPEELVQSLIQIDEGLPSLGGRRVLVTAGPTFEDIDPVRFIGNRSSGRMGYALARAAALAGAEVSLVSGPTRLAVPHGVNCFQVRSAAQMFQQVTELLDKCDIFIGCAAVADYTATTVASNKIKKVNETFQLDLKRTRDILAEVGTGQHRPAVVVGFAAETDQLKKHALGKLKRKGANMIVANQVGQSGCGFDAPCNEVTVFKHETGKPYAMASKLRLAVRLLHDIQSELAQ